MVVSASWNLVRICVRMFLQFPFVCHCLFVWSLSSHSRIFHSYGDVTIAGVGLQILTYARLSWSLSSKGIFIVPHLLWHEPTVNNGPKLNTKGQEYWSTYLTRNLIGNVEKDDSRRWKSQSRRGYFENIAKHFH